MFHSVCFGIFGLRFVEESSLMSYIMAFTVRIIFKSFRKYPYAFLVLELVLDS